MTWWGWMLLGAGSTLLGLALGCLALCWWWSRRDDNLVPGRQLDTLPWDPRRVAPRTER